MELVFGERRTWAVRDTLKKKAILARTVSVTSALAGEQAGNEVRKELQYRVEWCPCSGASGDTVELLVRQEGGRP